MSLSVSRVCLCVSVCVRVCVSVNVSAFVFVCGNFEYAYKYNTDVHVTVHYNLLAPVVATTRNANFQKGGVNRPCYTLSMHQFKRQSGVHLSWAI